MEMNGSKGENRGVQERIGSTMTNGRNVISGPPAKKIVPKVSLGQYLLDRLREHGDRIAEVDAVTGEILTHREILIESVKLAEALRIRGLKAGDKIAISSENRLSLPIPTCAALFLGVVVAPVNPSYTEGELLHAFSISKPKLIFMSLKTEKIVSKVAKTLSWSPQLVQLDTKTQSKDVPTLDSMLKGLKNFPDPYEYVAVDVVNYRKHVAAILYSSGTTGLPKGVMLTHHNVLTLLQYFTDPDFLNITATRTILGLVPYFHGYGFSLLSSVIAAGGKLIVMSGFDPEIFLNAIEKYKVAQLPIVPPIMVFLAKHPMVERFDLSSLDEIFCGAAPLSKELQMAVSKRLGMSNIRNGYGMTEVTVVTVLSPRGSNKFGTVGKLFPDTLCKVVDISTSKALGPMEEGEICFKGDLVMLGYCDNPKATAEMIDEDGWIHTGDLGYYDDEEFIFVVDRMKELIKYKGFQVAPAELEAILHTHPDLMDAAVVGKPDEMSGELPTAFVVRKPGSKPSPEAIQRFVDEKVSPQKRLRGGVRFIEAVPKNPSGKILRRELRKLIPKL